MTITALVVDDSATIRKVISSMLQKLQVEVREAENGQVAIEACEDEMPDFVMLDWNMPVMNGLDFLIALRKTPGGTQPKVILCTTENDFSHITQAMSEGANEYIMKPFNEDIIREKLEIVGLI